jgi:septal ring factor EnvC (AmiA/AmiB activator)
LGKDAAVLNFRNKAEKEALVTELDEHRKRIAELEKQLAKAKETIAKFNEQHK